MHHMDTDKAYEEKVWWQLHKNAANCNEQTQEANSLKAATLRPPTSHL